MAGGVLRVRVFREHTRQPAGVECDGCVPMIGHALFFDSREKIFESL